MQAVYQQKIKSLCEKFSVPFPLPLGRDAVISGSFMWHVLTSPTPSSEASSSEEASEEPKWFPNDLDIFCGISAVPRLREFLMEKGFQLGAIYEKSYMNEFYVENWYPAVSNSGEDPEATMSLLGFFRDFLQTRDLPVIPLSTKFSSLREMYFHIQLIYSKDCMVDAKSLIVDKFDFPTLENYFDGETTVVSYPDLVEKRFSTVRLSDEGWKKTVTERRMNKYLEERGMKFDKPKKAKKVWVDVNDELVVE